MMLQSKVAIVSGGDSGIGRAIVLALAQAGAAVTINYHRNQDAAEEVRRQVEQSGAKALAIQGDVASVVVWLASDQSAYVTATTYFIDGGIMQNSVGL